MIKIEPLKTNGRPIGVAFLVLLALYLVMFLPFWKPVVLGILFAAACGPLERRLRERLNTKRKSVAYAVLAVVSIGITVLLALIAFQTYTLLYQAFENTDDITALTQRLSGARDGAWAWLQSHGIEIPETWHSQVDNFVNSTLSSTRDILLNAARDFFAGTPELLLNLFIFALAFAAFLIMGTRAFVSVTSVLGVEGDHIEQIRRFERVCFLSLGSVILTGLVQATLVIIGARICNEGNYFLIFALTFVFSLIPILGAGLVPVMFVIFGLIQGDMFVVITMGITAGVTGVADNILKAWLFSKAAETNPAISLINLLGGIALLGFAGVFIAPTIEQLVMAEFHRRRDEIQTVD